MQWRKAMNRILLVMDFINDLVHPDGKIARSSAYVKEYKVIEKANSLIAWARRENIPIGFVTVGFSLGYPECPLESPVFGKAPEYRALQLGEWGTAFVDTLDVQPSDVVITKHRVSAFYGTKLSPFLHAQKAKHLILCGCSTDMVVQSTARDAHDRDFQVTIAADACGAIDALTHQKALDLCTRIAMISDMKTIIEY